MTDFADDLETAIIDWAFNDTAFPAVPGAIYVALHSGAPGDDAASNEIDTADGYSRQALDNPSDWTKTAQNQAESTASARFGPATADWGEITHASLWTAETGGLALFVGELDTPHRTILTEDEFELPANDILGGVD